MEKLKDYQHYDNFLKELGGKPVRIIWTYSDMASADIGHYVFRMPDGQEVISSSGFFGPDYSSGSGSWVEEL